MKVLLVLLVEVLAVAVARPGYLGAAHSVVPAAHAVVVAPHAVVTAHGVHQGLAAYGPAHIAVGPGGYVQDTHEVAATRAAHLTAVAQTQARDAHLNGAAAHAAAATHAAAAAHAAPLVAAHAAPLVAAHVAPLAAAHAAPLVAVAAPALPTAHGLLGAHGVALAHGHHW
ncbi:larval cuticle protein F1-like [Schistocerca serialis cubense]|uniref:larval cuticle protein F1-like n=1 Tax=Schistocerca serialis cubense TaxID=2023355 RepID=UPI00214E87DE|nr:larval cuticle protein F1-like [Schistocerca serialis cubense]